MKAHTGKQEEGVKGGHKSEMGVRAANEGDRHWDKQPIPSKGTKHSKPLEKERDIPGRRSDRRKRNSR